MPRHTDKNVLIQLNTITAVMLTCFGGLVATALSQLHLQGCRPWQRNRSSCHCLLVGGSGTAWYVGALQGHIVLAAASFQLSLLHCVNVPTRSIRPHCKRCAEVWGAGQLSSAGWMQLSQSHIAGD